MTHLDPTAQSAAYHRAFSTWLASCSAEDADRLDLLQALHPTPTVRPMKDFIRDCLADPVRRDLLPLTLVRQLRAENWQPARTGGAAA
jgi:hypothetical protein